MNPPVETSVAGAAADPARLKSQAAQALPGWQLAQAGTAAGLPAFDEAAVVDELQAFQTCCVEGKFGRRWNEAQQGWWSHSRTVLARNFSAQPQLPVRRLDGSLALGPISHDLAALLRDGETSFEEEQELDWAIRYWEQARNAGLPVDADFGTFWQQLEWTGLQRHLALLGQVSRVAFESGESEAGAATMDRLFAHAIKVTTRYVQLSPLTHLLQDLQGSLVQTGFTLR